MLDVLRWLVVTTASLITGAAFVVAARYGRDWKKEKGRGRLLPAHVWCVAMSYGLLLLLQTLVVLRNFGEHGNPVALSLYGVATVLGLVAILVMVRLRSRGE